MALGINHWQLLLVCESICDDLLARQLRGNELHWTALCVAVAATSEVLQDNGLALSLVLIASLCLHPLELLLSHLHKFALVLDLPLGQLECLVCNGSVVARDEVVVRILARD